MFRIPPYSTYRAKPLCLEPRRRNPRSIDLHNFDLHSAKPLAVLTCVALVWIATGCTADDTDGSTRGDSGINNDAGTGEPSSDGAAPYPDASVDASDVTPPNDGGSPDTTDGGETSDDAGREPPSDGGVAPDVQHEVNTWQEFSALSTKQGELKFLLPLDERAEHSCWFQNTETFPYHLQFLRTLPQYETLSAEAYEGMVLRREQRNFYAGVLRLFSGVAHPVTKQVGIVTYTVYTASTRNEVLTTEELAHIDRTLAACMGALARYLVYLPADQLALAAAQRDNAALAEANVAWISPSALQSSLDAAVYSPGEAYGYVKQVSDGELRDVGARDIVVTQSAPGDLGLVSALITEHVQSSVSHLNLRLREKRIPNVAAPKLFASGFFDSLEGTLVHVQTSDQGLTITPARLEDAQAFWKAQTPALPDPEFTLDVTELRSLASLKHEDLRAYGTKAANLGELRRALPEASVPSGIALPFAAYSRHLAVNGLGKAIQQTVERASLSSPAKASDLLSDLRKQIKQAPMDGEWEQELLEALRTQFGAAATTTRLRFRSSTNVEDLPGLSGAGLYDSASGCFADDLDDDDVGPSHCLSPEHEAAYRRELARLRTKRETNPQLKELDALIADIEEELTQEKSARKALRKVWSSLWNARAFQDRQYYGIPHDRVFMAVVVHPAMVGERLESVLVTNLEPEAAEPLYRVESQAGEVGVVEPRESDAVSERLQFRRSAADTALDVTLVNPSSFAQEGQSLWSDPQFTELATLTFQVQDHFATHVYANQDHLQLDLEVDVASDGTIVFKQARPYVSGGY